MFQTKVDDAVALGLVGELAFAGNSYSQTAMLKSQDNAHNVIGRAFTVVQGATASTALTVQAGGNGTFAGILCLPKTHAQKKLAPSLILNNGTMAELLVHGDIIIAPETAVNPGDSVFYDEVDGSLSFAPQDSPAPKGKIAIKDAKIYYYRTQNDDLAVLKL